MKRKIVKISAIVAACVAAVVACFVWWLHKDNTFDFDEE